MPSRRRLLVIAGASTLLLAACAGAPGVVQAPSSAAPTPAAAPGGGAALPSRGDSGQPAGPPSAGQQRGDSKPPPLGTPQGRIERDVTAHYVVGHGGFQDAFNAVQTRASELGGYVEASSTQPDSSGRIAGGQITVRVPAERLNDLMTGFPASFTVASIDYRSVDRTTESVDVAARLNAAVAHRTSLEKLRDHATSLAEITQLEQQIAQVQLEVEQDQGALNAVNARVDLASATIQLTEKDAPPPPQPDNPSPIVGALRAGWTNATAVVAAVTAALVTALPLLVPALAVVVALALRRRRPAALRPSPGGGPPA